MTTFAGPESDFDTQVCSTYKDMQDQLNCCKELGLPNDKCIRNLRNPELPTYTSGAQWYEGGTLHRATIEKWIASDYKDRLATSADFFVSISRKENPRLLDGVGSIFLEKIKVHATELEKCISEIGAEPKVSHGFLAAELGAMCYIRMYKSH
ncbi:hypothetical protein CKO09_00185 [Chromatium weissei]|nr:hypothetical protein [Chromatium weissei]